MSVFLTDGDQRATLAVARSLGRAGIPVTVGAESPTSLAGSSRYCKRHLVYPSPWEQGPAFQQAVESELTQGGYRALFPMTDVTTFLLAEIRDRLETDLALPIPQLSALRAAQDKRHMALEAQKLGIGVPPTFMIEESDDIRDVARRIRYPVVIKPRFSRFFRDGHWISGGVEYARNSEELLAKYTAAHALIPFPLVQEKIAGEGRGVFLLVWNGKLMSAFCHRRLREKPPWGGVSVLRESLPLDEPLVEKSFALLRAIGWQGVAMVEFKHDNSDGRDKLMEVNGRFWGSLQLAIDAGLDFPVLLYRVAMGESIAPQFDYRPGVKTRWLLGDLDHLLIRLTHPAARNGSSGPSRPRAFLDFLKFYQKDMHYEIESLDDPGPAWFESKTWLRQTLAPKRSGEGAGHEG